MEDVLGEYERRNSLLDEESFGFGSVLIYFLFNVL